MVNIEEVIRPVFVSFSLSSSLHFRYVVGVSRVSANARRRRRRDDNCFFLNRQECIRRASRVQMRRHHCRETNSAKTMDIAASCKCIFSGETATSRRAFFSRRGSPRVYQSCSTRPGNANVEPPLTSRFINRAHYLHVAAPRQ